MMDVSNFALHLMQKLSNEKGVMAHFLEYKYTDKVPLVNKPILSCIMLKGGALLIPKWDTQQYQDIEL